MTLQQNNHDRDGGSGEYHISQLAAAAYLLVCGHRLLRLERFHSNGRCLARFIFARDETIARNRMLFYERDAQVDARTFADALAEVKQLAMREIGKTEERFNAKYR